MKTEGNEGDNLLGRYAREALAEPVVVIGEHGAVVDANQAARTGRGLDVIAWVENGHADTRLTAFLSALRDLGQHTLELELPLQDGGARHFRLEGVQVGTHSVVLARDRGRNHAMEEELRQLRRVQALGFVTASVIHDFNNLMVPILCLSELLSKELGRGGSAAALATEVHFAAERAASLVRDVHALTRARDADHEPLDVNAVILDLRPLIERMLGSGIELSLALDQSLGEALAERERLEHSILNLVANARDAMPHGGRLTVTTSNVAFVADRSSGGSSAGPAYVALVVEDTGLGMTDAVRARVFDHFYTTKRAAGGTGLGLASVRRFVEDSGGLISLHSETGRGTLVTMHLPRVGRKERATIPDLGSPDAAGQGETILVVDDDEPVRRTVKAVLEACGYQVIGVRTAEDALRAAEDRKPPIDLALVDTALPRTDFPSFMQRLRASASGAGVLLMSTVEDPPELGANGTDRLLKKAFSAQELLRETRAALDALPRARARRQAGLDGTLPRER